VRRDRICAELTFGVCTWVWVAPFADADAGLAAHAAGLGFDVLEVCVEDPGLVSAGVLRTAGEEAGIAYSVCGAFGSDRDLAHEDPARRQNALEYLDRLYELAAAIGAPHVCGPAYSAVGKERRSDDARPAERARVVDGLKRTAERAAEQGCCSRSSR
jgi:D-psicose/D-tagatose/L-ribulose 3-epimerase